MTNDPIQRRFQYRITAPHRPQSPRNDRRVRSRRRLEPRVVRDRLRARRARADHRRCVRQRAPRAPPAARVRHRCNRRAEWAARSCSSPPISSATTRSAATAGRSRARRWSTRSAANGIRYERAVPQSVVCMPSRSTILTGQHPEHARRVDERRAAAGRRAVGRRAAPAPRLPNRARRQGALRAVHGSVRSLHREHARPVGRGDGATAVGRRHAPVRTVASSTSSSPRTAPPGCCTTRSGWPRITPRRSGCTTRRSTRRSTSTPPAAARRARRRCTTTRSRATGTTPTGSRDRTIDVARLARGRRRLVLLDELPRSAPSVGSAASRSCRASTRATCRSPRATRPTGQNAKRSSTRSPGTGGSGTTARSCRTTRRRRTGCRPRSPTTRCARSTRATRSSASSSTKRSAGCCARSTRAAGPTTPT